MSFESTYDELLHIASGDITGDKAIKAVAKDLAAVLMALKLSGLIR